MNNIGFEIQKANEELVFERIGFVPGYGTTTQSHTYSFIDSDVKSGKYSYRLKQIDYDGSFTYSELIELEVNQPITFFLDQNFPNPFNPLTTISFGIADKSNVVLTVFDVIGTEITTLVNEEKEAGKYKVSFDAKTLPSGIYFYTLKTNQFIQTRKMILLR
jgi:hypothetical protein